MKRGIAMGSAIALLALPALASAQFDFRKNGKGGASAATPADFFTYLLNAPSAGSQCTDAALVSDQADAITCTRASTAYCTKADGTMVSHSNNRCRVEQHGVLMEAARTNLCLRSQEIGGATGWSNSGTTYGAANAVTAPDGTATAENVVLVTSNAQHFAYSASISETGASVYTKSIYLDPDANVTHVGISVLGTTSSYVVFALSGAGSVVATNNASGTITALGSWYRVTHTYTSPGGGAFIVIHPGASQANATPGASWLPGGMYTLAAWGGQNELGSNVSSHIPTAGTSATRARDLLSTTLTQSVDAAGCFAATVRHGTVYNASNGWISTDQGGLYASSATGLEEATSGASIVVPSLLSTATTARAYWSGATAGLESGGTSDEAAFGGSMSSDSIISFGDYLDGHIRGIRVNTSADGCQ
jgi:hypothetical protein